MKAVFALERRLTKLIAIILIGLPLDRAQARYFLWRLSVCPSNSASDIGPASQLLGQGLLAFAIKLVAGTLSALLVEQPMLRMRKRIGPLTWLDNVWLAFRAIAKSERRFLSVFYRMRHNSGHAINSGVWAISAGTNRRDLTAPNSDLAAGAGPNDILKRSAEGR